MTSPTGTVHARLFAGAAEACGAHELTVQARTLEELIARLGERGPEAQRVIDKCAFLANGVRVDGVASLLEANTTIDVLPPFAGG